jgi:hypothetical protein
MSYRQELLLYKQAVKVAAGYIEHEDVNDIFFGRKYVEKQSTNELSIRFNVTEKKPKSKLKSNRVLPKRIGNFKTDITEFKLKKDARNENQFTRVRPLLGGLQIQSSLFGNDPSNWGTMGCVLKINGVAYGITNYHVSFGETDLPQGGLKMFQPKSRNFGTPVGNITSIANNQLDYSLFTISVSADGMQSINGFNGEIEGFTNPFGEMRMFKFGASTGKTFGFFDGHSLIDQNRIAIRYDAKGPNDSARISSPGDSGSVWVTSQNASPGNLRMVALHYGGDEIHNVAFASLFSSISPSIRNKIPLP